METNQKYFLSQEEPDCGSSQLRIKPMCHSEAHKLDVLMDLVLHYIHNTCYLNGENIFYIIYLALIFYCFEER